MNKTTFRFLIHPPVAGGKSENAFCVSGTPLPVRLRINWQTMNEEIYDCSKNEQSLLKNR